MKTISKTSLEIMDGIMDAVVQTDEWQSIAMSDPLIKDAEAEIDALLDQAKQFLPRDLYMKISDAVYAAAGSHDLPAMLYGIHVAEAIREVSAHPEQLSRHILDRIQGKGE